MVFQTYFEFAFGYVFVTQQIAGTEWNTAFALIPVRHGNYAAVWAKITLPVWRCFPG